MNYFEDWGSKKNPIRQSDLKSLFGSVFGCAKQFFMSKTFEKDYRTAYSKMALGEIVHDIIMWKLHMDKKTKVSKKVQQYESDNKIQIKFEDKEKEIDECQKMIDLLFESKEFQAIQQRHIDSERSFLVEIGKTWVAGTIDAVISGKKKDELVVIDWKTGYPPMSQYEMDNGYQSKIYCEAIRNGEFFLRPSIAKTGMDYFKSYSKTGQKNQYGSWPSFRYAYLKELIPAEKKSKKKSSHVSSEKFAVDGYLNIEKGKRKGPIFYEANVDKNIKRLEYTLSCAVAMARSGLFPECMSHGCVKCSYSNRCESLSIDAVENKQEVFGIMNELGIEPD